MAIATTDMSLLLLTAEGLVRCRVTDPADRIEVLGVALDDDNIREVCPDPFDPHRLYATSTADVYLSEDGGERWEQLPAGGLDYREIWTLSVHPTRPNEIYVGTLPAAVYVSENGGRSFRELTSFRQLPDYERWTFPPPPHTAHIRSIALDARVPDEILVGIEEGGVARSRDRGQTWEDISGPPSSTAYPAYKDVTGQSRYQPGQRENGRVYRDVHQVVRHPERLDTIYATSGLGTYRSDDAGGAWTGLDRGMPLRYSVLLAVHPGAPDRLFLGAAEYGPPAWKGHRTPRPGPFNNGRYSRDVSDQVGGAHCTIFRSDDAETAGGRWAAGYPPTTPPWSMGYAFTRRIRTRSWSPTRMAASTSATTEASAAGSSMSPSRSCTAFELPPPPRGGTLALPLNPEAGACEQRSSETEPHRGGHMTVLISNENIQEALHAGRLRVEAIIDAIEGAYRDLGAGPGGL
jgi:hypothetical protein